MEANWKHYLILNLTVFVWGFTGILGDEITVGADTIVFFRMGFAFLSLILIGFFYRKKQVLSKKQILMLLGTGAVVAMHWYAFFLSIKSSNVSVGVVCMSSATLFTAILEPLIFKRKSLKSEFILGIAIVIGILFIVGFEPQYILGIVVGLTSAFLAAFFGVLNGMHIKKMPAFQITKFEMLGGFIAMTLIFLFTNKINAALFVVPNLDWVYLIILAIICTTVPFLLSVWLMKYLSPFTVSMGINMEPIYAILIALLIDYARGESSEQMSIGFYSGTIIIIGAIFLNAYFKRKRSKS